MSTKGPRINKSTTSKYQSSYCDDFINHCKEGGSIAEFCFKKNVSRKTFDTWSETYPDFNEARIRGKNIAEGWWLNQARIHLVTYSSKDEGSTNFDTSLYKHIVGGRFGHAAKRKFRFPQMGTDVLENYLRVIEEAQTNLYEAVEVKAAVDVVLAGMTIIEHVQIKKELDAIKAMIGEQKQKVEGRADEIDDGA